MKTKKYLTLYNSFFTQITIVNRYEHLKYPQLVLFSLILAITEQNGTCTQAQLIKANNRQNKGYSQSTTIKHIERLVTLGFIQKTRNAQYFSYSFITLTKEGLLLKSRISSLLSSKLNY